MLLTGEKKFKNLCEKHSSIWMGIVNLTPDSFSDGGKFSSHEKALLRSLELIKNGALILDFGGISTRPYSSSIPPKQELDRVYETIFKIKPHLPKEILISIDSYSPFVTSQLASEGLIDIINDQFSARHEETIPWSDTYKNINNAQIAAKFSLGYVIMHMQSKPSCMQINPYYKNCSNEILLFLKERIQYAESQGVKFLAVDPGIGFGKTLENNLEILSQNFLNLLLKLNKPILIGLSRKSFLGQLYPNLFEPHTRDYVSKEYELKCISNGVKIIRSHVMPSEL